MLYEAAEMHRNVLGLAQRGAGDIEQGGGAVKAVEQSRRSLMLVEVLARTSALAHLLGDRGERAADDFHCYRVDRGYASYLVELAY